MRALLIQHAHTSPLYSYIHTHSTSSHSFSSLSSTGPANSAFSQPQSLEADTTVVAPSLSEEDGSSQPGSLDANQSGDSIGNSSFGEEPGPSGSGNSAGAPLTIGQQKATAILPEIHPVTGEYVVNCYLLSFNYTSASFLSRTPVAHA